MELTAEETVTRLLSQNEVISKNDEVNSFASNPIYNLGEFLKNYKPEPSSYEGKYIFIR